MTDETKNDGGTAFPLIWNVAHNSDWQTEGGMTLRDYFAGQALAGSVSAKPMTFDTGQAAKYFYDLADAMLKAREK